MFYIFVLFLVLVNETKWGYTSEPDDKENILAVVKFLERQDHTL